MPLFVGFASAWRLFTLRYARADVSRTPSNMCGHYERRGCDQLATGSIVGIKRA